MKYLSINREYIINTLIKHGETSMVEFKSARGGFPGSFWETYSAFANTNGGTIVLGVVEKDNRCVLDELTEELAVKYKKTFWDCAHNRGKISACLPKESDVRIGKIGKSYLLVCHIPRAHYDIRPVYISNNPFGNTYRRNHEGDYLCTDTEVRRMFADADHEHHSRDGRIMTGFNIERDIDKESFRQYRRTFASLQPTHPWVGISDTDFMKKIGAYATDFETGKKGLTMAGILMFGVYDSITNNAGKPDFFVDYRERIAEDNPNSRWSHRIYPDGLWEANLYQFYVKVYNRLILSLPRPFIIKNDVRQEETPAHDAVREALINCIIHHDTYAKGHIIVERTNDSLIFRNPGMMLVSQQQYFEGGRSICRNPILQKMFMRLGRAEKAGSGVDKIVSGWNYLGLPAPKVEEESRPDYVVLTLKLKKETYHVYPITPPAAPDFANESTPVYRKTPQVDKRIPQVTPQDDKETPQVAQNTPQVTPQDDNKTPQVTQNTPQVTPQDDNKTPQVAPQDKSNRKYLRKLQILDFCVKPKSLKEIICYLGLKDRKSFMELYINPMIADGTLTMTEPDKPTSSKQRYLRTINK